MKAISSGGCAFSLALASVRQGPTKLRRLIAQKRLPTTSLIMMSPESSQRSVFYPLSTRDTSGYCSHMNSTNARTFGAGRRLDVCKTQSSTSTPETLPH